MESAETFFSVQHAVAVNIHPLAEQNTLPEMHEFEKEIPAPFLIASEHTSLEATSLRNLRNQHPDNQDLVNYLALQSKKIDMLMGYLLALQDQPEQRHQSTEFSASGFTYITTNAPEIDTHLQLKLFLHEESNAVFCYGQVITVTSHENGQLVEVRYTRIREQDREVLVRATLHIQSRLLKERSEKLLEQSKHNISV